MIAALVHLAAAVAGAVALSTVSWQAPRGSGAAPWVSDVSPPLALAFVLLALVLSATAVALSHWVTGGRLGARRLIALSVTLAVSCAAGVWNAMYAATFGPEDNPIPIFDWLFSAVPVLVAALLALGCALPTMLAVGLLAAAPLWAVSVLGWGVQASAFDALRAGVLFQGFGTVIALCVAWAVWTGGRAPDRPAATPAG